MAPYVESSDKPTVMPDRKRITQPVIPALPQLPITQKQKIESPLGEKGSTVNGVVQDDSGRTSRRTSSHLSLDARRGCQQDGVELSQERRGGLEESTFVEEAEPSMSRSGKLASTAGNFLTVLNSNNTAPSTVIPCPGIFFVPTSHKLQPARLHSSSNRNCLIHNRQFSTAPGYVSVRGKERSRYHFQSSIRLRIRFASP